MTWAALTAAAGVQTLAFIRLLPAAFVFGGVPLLSPRLLRFATGFVS